MKEHPFWLSWAHFLQHWGIDQVVADLLEVTGPLSIFLAQGLYLSQPFLASFLPEDQLQALAGLCENQPERHSFATFLRKEVTR